MEVFMRNLPPDLTDQGLKVQLTPFLKSLSISDWDCHKQRKKTYGNVTFLQPDDGHRFLRQHEEQPIPGVTHRGQRRTRARLHIMGTAVYCARSKHAPDLFLLRSLAKTAEDRRHPEPQSAQVEDTKIVFGTERLSCGYYTYAKDELVYCAEMEWLTLQGVAKFVKNAFIVKFTSPEGLIRVEIPYRIIESIVISTRPTALTLTLWEAPRFFHGLDQNIMAMMSALNVGNAPNGAQQATKTRLPALPNTSQNHHEIISQSLVYRISVSAFEFHEKTEQLRWRDLLSISHHNLPSVPSYSRRSLVEALQCFSITARECANDIPFDVLYQLEALVKNGYLLPWTVSRLIKLMLKAALTDPTIRGRANGPIQSVAKQTFPISASAVRKLFSRIPFPSPEVDPSTFEVNELWEYLKSNEEHGSQALEKELISERARQNLTMVYKVQVTPTSTTLKGPEPEAKNRILRRFPDHIEYFIRVQFCDEDGTDLQFNSRVDNSRIYTRFKDVFNNGIAIAGRVYSFLGFSHSSLRSHSAWFMAPFFHRPSGQLQTYFTVISDLGKFRNITSPARCAARIGQAFSETPFTISLAVNGIQAYEIPDVVSRDGTRVFSDGVGTISRSVVEAIHEAMPQRSKKSRPTCFQIRWGGAKGMLGLDDRLEDNSVRFRPSMIKFESDNTANLEICDMANKPIPLVLNRQMIKILEDMAVPNDWFFKQQSRELERLRLITVHTVNTVSFLKRQKIGEHIRFPQLINKLDKIGVDYKKDRFLRSVVEATILRELRLLKHKARIPVEEGVTLFGIMDETGFLDKEEVYITFDREYFVSSHYLDLDGCEMIVTRSPALHPGDIQLVTNVVPPDDHPLRSLNNCIVFSRKGERDMPSCLSGGDLDGDIYNIIWDQHAVGNCKRVFTPADYPRVEPLNIGREVRREDMTNFFIDFMATDQLGLIAVKHMILADQREAGTVDADCQLLAQMHSTGVDYSKTGIAVDMSLLKGIKSNRYRPDFLAPAPTTNIKDRTEIYFDAPITLSSGDVDEDEESGPNFQYYHSDKILGQLYRSIDEKNIWHHNVKIPVAHGASMWDSLLSYIKSECEEKLGGLNWNKAIPQAWTIRNAYEDAIDYTTYDFSDHAARPITELEVFTGNIFNKSGSQTPRQRDKSVKLKDEFDRITQWAEAMMRKQETSSAVDAPDDDDVLPNSTGAANGNQADEIDSDGSKDGPNDSLALSLACLVVGCSKEQRNAPMGSGRRSRAEFHSFKVIAACCVVKELDVAIKRADIAAGSAVLEGENVGAGAGSV